jgi:large subunit ribosomal protein L25
MEQIVLEVEKREETGKVAAKLLRQKGLIPVVLYGKKTKTFPLKIQAATFKKVLEKGGVHKIFNLKVSTDHSSEEKTCVIQEIQKDPFGKIILHVDFHEISMQDKIKSKIPLELTGTSPGIKEGGIVDHVLWEVEVESLPLNLPEKILIDISTLTINQSLHVRDIKPLEGVEILNDPEEVLVVIHPPRTEEAPAAAEATLAVQPAAPTQPEVISKGKKEEEETPEEKPKK